MRSDEKKRGRGVEGCVKDTDAGKSENQGSRRTDRCARSRLRERTPYTALAVYEKAINRSNLGDLCTITSPTRDIRPCAPCERALKHSVFLFLFLLCASSPLRRESANLRPTSREITLRPLEDKEGGRGHLLFRLVLIHFSSHCSASRARSRPRNAAIRHRRTRARETRF